MLVIPPRKTLGPMREDTDWDGTSRSKGSPKTVWNPLLRWKTKTTTCCATLCWNPLSPSFRKYGEPLFWMRTSQEVAKNQQVDVDKISKSNRLEPVRFGKTCCFLSLFRLHSICWLAENGRHRLQVQNNVPTTSSPIGQTCQQSMRDSCPLKCEDQDRAQRWMHGICLSDPYGRFSACRCL